VSSFGYPQNPKETPPDMSRPYWNFSINYRGDEPCAALADAAATRERFADDAIKGNAIGDSQTGLHHHQRQGRRYRSLMNSFSGVPCEIAPLLSVGRHPYRKYPLRRLVHEFTRLVIAVAKKIPRNLEPISQFPDIGRFLAAKW
jgi:hypothetical protein